MSTPNTTPIPVPLDDAVILIRVRAKGVTAAGIHLTDKELDKERRVCRVVAVGPGKLIPMGGGYSEVSRVLTTDRVDGVQAEALLGPCPCGPITPSPKLEPARYPMNVKPGDYVVCSQGTTVAPYGSTTQEFVITRNELILCIVPDFEEQDEQEEVPPAVPGMLVPIPRPLVDPTTGMPFRPRGEGRG